MPCETLISYLDSQGVRYVVIGHTPAYTAQEIAAAAHIPGKEVAKTVMIKIGGKIAMAVLPSSYRMNFKLLRQVVGDEDVELATENEFKDLFPDCDVGAMPPFGNVYGMDVYVAEKLAENEMIAFNAGTHSELVRMAYEDYERIVKPTVIKLSYVI